MSRRASSTALPRCGSTDTNGISTSLFAAATSRISSFETGTSPVLCWLSTQNITAAIDARAIVVGDLLHVRPREVRSKVLGRRVEDLHRPRIRLAAQRHLSVGMDVDRANGSDVDAHSSSSFGSRTP